MQNILFLLDNPYSIDRRVIREAESLQKTGLYNVIVVATKSEGYANEELMNGVVVRRIFNSDIFDIKNYSASKKYALQIHKEFQFDIIHAHDQVMLNVAIKLKKLTEKKVIYDSHELFRCWPLNTSTKGFTLFKSKIVRKLLINREAKNIKNIDGLIAVNESIQNDIITNFKLKLPSVSIRNVPELPLNTFFSNILREEFKVSDETKLLVYIGAHVYPRTINIEQVIDHFANKENTVFIIISKKNWAQIEVEKYVKLVNAKNIFFRDVVAPSDILKYLSSADVGIVSSWNKKDLSYWYGLDNKLFEYMMSEVPILATKQPEYVRIVEEYQIGKCIDPDKENFYDNFLQIISKKEYYKNNIQSTKKVLNWEIESLKLLEFYKAMLF
jgi:glycosyltransferase involved in cell wall biosynthesis